MKNMGLRHLALVKPKLYPSAEATARASGADDILAAARVHDCLEEALESCDLVIGASARPRSIAWPSLGARECADMISGEGARRRVAILFGREHAGLTNAELDRCHYLLHIPCNAQYPSLNLAAAVQIVAYELLMAAGSGAAVVVDNEENAANSAEMEGFYRHLEQVLVDVAFLDPGHPKKLMRRLRRRLQSRPAGSPGAQYPAGDLERRAAGAGFPVKAVKAQRLVFAGFLWHRHMTMIPATAENMYV